MAALSYAGAETLSELFTGERVRVLGDDRYREVWLARPAARNAIDVRMRDELASQLECLIADRGITGIGLLGEGPDFCAGGDLSEFGTRSDVVSAWHVRLVRSLPTLVVALADRLVAGIQGAAIGAGIELAAAARTIVAAENASFRLPELSFGLIPGSGGTTTLPRRIGSHHTLELGLLGRPVGADRAVALGLVDEIVAADELVARVRGLAHARSVEG